MIKKKIRWSEHADICFIPIIKEMSRQSRNDMWYNRYEYRYMIENNRIQVYHEKDAIQIDFEIIKPNLQSTKYSIRHNYFRSLGILI